MQDTGRRVLPDMNPEAFVMNAEIEQRLTADRQVYDHFAAFPLLYQRVRIDTIQSVKRQPALFKADSISSSNIRRSIKCMVSGMIMEGCRIKACVYGSTGQPVKC